MVIETFHALESCHTQDMETGEGQFGSVQGQKPICLGSSECDTLIRDKFREQLLHGLLELNSLCLATAWALKSLRTFEVEQRVSEGHSEIWEGKQIWIKKSVPCSPSASLGESLAMEYRSDLGMGNRAHPTWRVTFKWVDLSLAMPTFARDISGAGQLLVTLLPKLSHRKCLLSTDDSHYTCLFKASLVLYSVLWHCKKREKPTSEGSPSDLAQKVGTKIIVIGPGLPTRHHTH